jgi:hypothetical protein
VNAVDSAAPDDADAEVMASIRKCPVTMPWLPASNMPSSIGWTTRVERSL